jgi:hypothetical protein
VDDLNMIFSAGNAVHIEADIQIGSVATLDGLGNPITFNCFSDQALPDLGINCDYVSVGGYVTSPSLGPGPCCLSVLGSSRKCLGRDRSSLGSGLLAAGDGFGFRALLGAFDVYRRVRQSPDPCRQSPAAQEDLYPSYLVFFPGLVTAVTAGTRYP